MTLVVRCRIIDYSLALGVYIPVTSHQSEAPPHSGRFACLLARCSLSETHVKTAPDALSARPADTRVHCGWARRWLFLALTNEFADQPRYDQRRTVTDMPQAGEASLVTSHDALLAEDV